jgi:RHS repeat-associated protein
VLAESDLSGNLISEYAFFNKQRIARRDISSGNVYYLFHDRLGSYRTLTDSSGNVKGESDYYPFGAERLILSTVTDDLRFAGMEWDPERGLNHTLYRQYTPAQCRWESPDPVQGCVNFPQGQNLYAYVKDGPTNLVDPNGDQNCTDWENSADPCTCCAQDSSFWSANSEMCCDECDVCYPPSPGQPRSTLAMVYARLAACSKCVGECLEAWAEVGLGSCVIYCASQAIYGQPAVEACVEGCLKTYGGEAATFCGLGFVECLFLGHGLFFRPNAGFPPVIGYT